MGGGGIEGGGIEGGGIEGGGIEGGGSGEDPGSALPVFCGGKSLPGVCSVICGLPTLGDPWRAQCVKQNGGRHLSRGDGRRLMRGAGREP
jgi:hypothetical protein